MYYLVVSWPRPPGSILAKPRYRCVDQFRILDLEIIPTHTEPIHHPGTEVLNKYIGAPYKPFEQRDAFLGLQVQRYRTLPRILRQE